MLISETIIRNVMNEVVELFLKPKFLALGMNASGEWLSSIEVVATSNEGQIWGREYTEQLVYGRMPGKRPPIAPIERWVNAKLGLGGTEGRSLAFAISNKIANEGTSWYEKGGTDLLEVLESDEVISYINNRVGEEVLKELTIVVNRNVQQMFT